MGFKRGNSNSTLFGKIDKTLNLFAEAINGDKELVRYMAFLTKQPLENRSTDYGGNILYQYDVPSKIDCYITYKTSKLGVTPITTRSSEQILFLYPSEDSKITGDYPTMFIYNFDYNLGTKYADYIDTNRFKIDILIPLKYIEIFPYGYSRLHKIMERLAYLFDRVELDEVSKAELGDLKFQLVGNCVEQKINKTNDIIVTSLFIETKLIGARTDGRNIIK